ncbi:MAG: hypothetical protein KDC35_00065 [Acidobacteria bacterium]|nr:hypothetical protein [Acidobacteriota bacterium]
MTTLLFTLTIFGLCFAGMAIGFIVRGISLKGSCGGAAEILGEPSCGACAKKEKELCPSDDESGLLRIAELGNPRRTEKDRGQAV